MARVTLHVDPHLGVTTDEDAQLGWWLNGAEGEGNGGGRWRKGPTATTVGVSLRWKLRWQLQAAHLSASRVPSSPEGMNSPHPSVILPPVLAAWFFKHSRYLGGDFRSLDPTEMGVAEAPYPSNRSGSDP